MAKRIIFIHAWFFGLCTSFKAFFTLTCNALSSLPWRMEYILLWTSSINNRIVWGFACTISFNTAYFCAHKTCINIAVCTLNFATSAQCFYKNLVVALSIESINVIVYAFLPAVHPLIKNQWFSMLFLLLIRMLSHVRTRRRPGRVSLRWPKFKTCSGMYDSFRTKIFSL